MEKKILILLILLVLPIISADQELIINPTSENELISNNFGDNQLFFQSPNTPPIITLISPDDSTTDTDGTVSFIYNPTDTNNISSCSLIYDSNTYITVSSVSKGVNNVMTIIGITSGHALYSENLQWSITCTDQYGRIGTSETRSLRTKPATVTPQTGGGGSTMEVGNPKNINIFYAENWERGKDQIIEIETYDKRDKLYKPNKIEINSLDLGITLKDSDFIINKTINILRVSELAELGNKTIEIIITDERVLKENILINVIDPIKLEDETILISKNNKIIFWICIGIILIFLILFFIILIMIDKRRKGKK